MKIVGMRVELQRFGLEEPYAIAYQEVAEALNLFVGLQTDAGPLGLGCAAPDPDVTGETADAAQSALEGPLRELVLGRDPVRWSRILEDAARAPGVGPSALAALDMALHDLLGKAAGLPLWQLLGGYRSRIRTSVTIGILPLDETVSAARRRVAQGFAALKLKGGADVDADVRRVLAVRRAVGPKIGLRFDANQGYGRDAALHFVRETLSAKLELLEQPVARESARALHEVTRRAPLRIMADESLLTLADAFRIARGELADLVNVKLMKVGGLAAAGRIDAVARAAGIGTMIGCMDEAALPIAAGLHFALARRNVVFADLDGHLGLIGDPTRGAVRLRDGWLHPAPGPGLGVADWPKTGLS